MIPYSSYIGIVRHGNVVCRGGGCRHGGILTRQGILEVCPRLSEPEPEIGVFHQGKRVAFANLDIIVEIHLLDKALHPAVDGYEPLVNLRIVGIGRRREADKFTADPGKAEGDEQDDRHILKSAANFLFHNVSLPGRANVGILRVRQTKQLLYGHVERRLTLQRRGRQQDKNGKKINGFRHYF